MKLIKSLLFSSFVALAACGGGSKDSDTTPGGGTSCADTAASLSATMRTQGAEMSDEELAAIEGQVATACTDDGWSAEVKACFASADSGEATQACSEQLTPEQQQGLASMFVQGEGDGGEPISEDPPEEDYDDGSDDEDY